MKLVNADDMFEYMKSEDGAIQLGHSPVRFLDVKRVIESVPTIAAIPVEWLEEHDGEDIKDSDGNIYGRRRITVEEALSMWRKEQEAR